MLHHLLSPSLKRGYFADDDDDDDDENVAICLIFVPYIN
jgi:hypothetical protein